jgi:hypothetical protein
MTDKKMCILQNNRYTTLFVVKKKHRLAIQFNCTTARDEGKRQTAFHGGTDLLA